MCMTDKCVHTRCSENQSKTCSSPDYTCENKPGYVSEFVCGGGASDPTETRLIYLREKYKQQSKDETDPALKVLSQSLQVHHSLPIAVHSRCNTVQPVSGPSFVDMIYTDGFYINGLESMFPQQVKKTKASLNLLCLNWGDLHQCIFVRGQTWIPFCLSSGA